VSDPSLVPDFVPKILCHNSATVIIPIPWVLMGIGALISLLSIPLILKTVPMNRGYGFRMRKAFVSDAYWYAINSFGGKAFFAGGILLAVFAWAMRDSFPAPRSPLAPVYLVGSLLAFVGVPLLAVQVYAACLPDR
jgi:SdpI/YfhL protein family